jgi:hypothetical protein
MTAKVAGRFGVKQIDHIQEYDYIVSNTTIDLDNLIEVPDAVKGLEQDTNKLNLIRMVFMNQWHEKLNSKGVRYTDHFIQTLIEFIQKQ